MDSPITVEAMHVLGADGCPHTYRSKTARIICYNRKVPDVRILRSASDGVEMTGSWTLFAA
jgi:hypothetical protein